MKKTKTVKTAKKTTEELSSKLLKGNLWETFTDLMSNQISPEEAAARAKTVSAILSVVRTDIMYSKSTGIELDRNEAKKYLGKK